MSYLMKLNTSHTIRLTLHGKIKPPFPCSLPNANPSEYRKSYMKPPITIRSTLNKLLHARVQWKRSTMQHRLSEQR